MIERVIRAVKLDATFYREAHDDQNLTGEAFLLVAIIGAVAGAMTGLLTADGSLVTGLIGGVIGAPIGLVISSGILLLIGRLFKGTATYSGLLRSLAYAATPGILGWIPFVGFLVGLWAWVCSVIAVRESHKVTTGVAVVIVLIPTIILLILGFVLVAALVALILGAAASAS